MKTPERYDRLMVNALRRFAGQCRLDAVTAQIRGRKTECHALSDLADFLEYAASHTDQLVWNLKLPGM